MSEIKTKNSRKIDVALVSAMKSGSTYLAEVCSRHSEIYLTQIGFKEDSVVLDMDKYKGEKVVAVRRNMKPIERDAQVYYALNRDMKFVMLLRNPVNRSFSQFAHHVRKHLKLKKPINVHPDAINKNVYDINRDIEIKKQEYLDKQVGWVTKSEFYSCLAPFLNAFPRENFFIVPLELFTEDPERWLKDIFTFMGVSADAKIKGLDKKVNRGKYGAGILDRLMRRKIPEFPPLTESSKRFLARLFADDVRKMEELIGMDLARIWKLDKYL